MRYYELVPHVLLYSCLRLSGNFTLSNSSVKRMDENNAQSVECISKLFPATAIMKGDPYTASTAVSGTTPRVVIVIQLADEIPNACTYRPILAVIMCETFEAGRPAFTDLSAFAKMEYFPMWNFYAICSFYHSSESSSP